MGSAAALHGTWRMVSWKRKMVSSGVISDAMGPDPVGFLSYQPDGRMMALVVSNERPGANGKMPTASEKVALFDSMLAYAGTYTFDNGRVIHHVDASWNPAWGVSDLIRPFSIDGNKLVISGAPGVDPTTGEAVIYELEFRKI
jgi:hypothetical protein